MRIINYKDFIKVNEEASPRLPKDLEYWTRKGKDGKKVALYTHDDMDGIFSAIAVKQYLNDNGFEIVKYGILDYSNGWGKTEVDPKLINVVVDFANMPGDERDQYIDYYLDHHGVFTEEQKEKYKKLPVGKTSKMRGGETIIRQKDSNNYMLADIKKYDPETGELVVDIKSSVGESSGEPIDNWVIDLKAGYGDLKSAYEGICLNLQIPLDELTVSVIRMIDSALYDEYEVSWKRLLDYNLEDIIKSAKKALTKKGDSEKIEFISNTPNNIIESGEQTYKVSTVSSPSSEKKLSLQGRLEFAAAFNQMLKRGDHKTLISVIHNCDSVSIYKIFNTMVAVYPEHNTYFSGPKKGQGKDFLADAEWRLKEMQKKTRGSKKQKKVYRTQQDFLQDFEKSSVGDARASNSFSIFSDGYALIGDLAFVPTGTWANALRARTIIMEDYEMGVIMGKIEKAVSDGIIDKVELFNVDKLKQFLTEDEIYLMSRRIDNYGNVWTIPQVPKFILLQYGGTLQVCAYSNIKEMKNIPKYGKGPKGGQPINDLGVYMTSVLNNFKEYLNYYDPDTSIGQDEITVSGGHGGIGSISNIFGSVKVEKETDDEGNEIEVSKIILTNEGKKYIDLFKNIIIRDLSSIEWSFGLKWKEDKESSYTAKEPEMNFKVLDTEDVTKLDKYGKPIPKNESRIIKKFRKF
jgi:hypothetical protein